MSVRPSFDVIVCGSLHLDIVVNVPALPRIDETAVGSAWTQVCGGKGGNQAVQAARAGARTAMIGRIGRDEFGNTLLANLEHENVDASAIGVDERVGSGMSVAILQTDGNYGAVIVSGANLAIDPKALADQWRALGAAQVLVLQNEVPHAVNVEMAAAARRAGAQVLLNAAPARDLGSDLLDLVDVLIVNRVEAEMLFGSPVVDCGAAVKILSGATFRGSVVITLGGDGLVLRTTAGEVRAIAPVPVTVTSTHGAGDCFVGVLAREMARGSPLPEACGTANRAAAAFVSRPSKP